MPKSTEKETNSKMLDNKQINKKIEKYVTNQKLNKLKNISTSDLFKFFDDEYINIFLFAVRKSNIKIVMYICEQVKKYLIKKNKSDVKYNEFIHSLDSYKRNALVLAIIADDKKIVDYLYNELHFDIHQLDTKNRSLLYYASSRNCQESFHYLISTKVQLTCVDEGNITKNEDFRVFFNSAENFLELVKLNHIKAFNIIMRHIKTLSAKNQQDYIQATDDDCKNALILAASLSHNKIFDLLATSGLNFDLTDVDDSDHGVLSYLAKYANSERFYLISQTVSKISQAEAKILASYLENIVDDTKNSRIKLANSLTVNPGNVNQTGKTSKTRPDEIVRKPHSFNNSREIQLLRQLSTQIYFFLEEIEDIHGLVEAQIMHMEFSKKHSLFLAINKFELTKYLPKIIDDSEISEILTTEYTPRREEGKVRSSRFASKLSARIFGKKLNIPESADKDDDYRARCIGYILRNCKPIFLHITIEKNNELSRNSQKIIKGFLRNNKNKFYIIVVDSCNNKDRHAEEFLTDIAEYANKLANKSKVDIHTTIAGKKRPCYGCLGRMTNVISNFNKYPGRFWNHTMKEQTHDNALKTANKLLNKAAYITLCADEETRARDYCSGSDTDADDNTDSNDSSSSYSI